MPLKNDFKDNRTSALSSYSHKKSNTLSENFLGTKTKGLSADSSMDSLVGINNISE